MKGSNFIAKLPISKATSCHPRQLPAVSRNRISVHPCPATRQGVPKDSKDILQREEGMESASAPGSGTEGVPQVNKPAKLTEEEQKEVISKAREPHDGQQGNVPPAQEKEGYVADLDE